MAEASDVMVLATGNKSELSIDAGILGGDMTGDFAPLRPAEALDRTPTLRSRSDLTLPSTGCSARSWRALSSWGRGSWRRGGRLPAEDGGELDRPDHRARSESGGWWRRGVKITARAWGKDLHMPVTNGWRPFG